MQMSADEDCEGNIAIELERRKADATLDGIGMYPLIYFYNF